MELDPVSLSSLYRWIDTIPLDRPKKNIARDFSDGVLMSQVLYYFFPKLVELHNYSASNSLDQKNYNWKTLNQKVFKKMGFMISPVDIDAVVQCKKHAIERILLLIQAKIGEYQQQLANEAAAPSHTKLPPAQQSPQQQQQQQQQPYQQPAPAAAAAPSKKSTKSQSSSQHRQSSSPTRSNPSKAAPSQSSSQYPPQSHSQPSQQQPSQPSLSLPSLPNGKLNGDKDATIHDLRETVDILQLKVQKLEQLLRLKNSKIESLQKRLVEVTGQPM